MLTSDGEGGQYWHTPSGGGGGTSDYSDLTNKPSINSVTLSGNKSLSDLGIASASSVGIVDSNQKIVVDLLEPSTTETGKYATSSSGKVNKYNISASSLKTYDVSSMIGETVYFTAYRNASPYTAYVMIADSSDNWLTDYIDSSHDHVTNQAVTIPASAKWLYLNYLTAGAEDGRVIMNLDSSKITDLTENVTAKSSGVVGGFHAIKGTKVKRVEVTNTSGTTLSSFTMFNSGRNMLTQTFTSATTKNNVTFTPNNDGTVTVNGTATGNAYITYGSFYVPINSDEKFKLTGCAKNGGSTRYRMYLAATGTTVYDYGEGTEFTASGQELSLVIYVPNGAKCENLVFAPMVTHNDYSDEYEKPNTTYWTVTLSNLLDGKTVVFEDGGIYIDGIYITTTSQIIAKEAYSHVWAYSNAKSFSIKSIFFEDENYVNNEISYLNDIHSQYISLKGKKVVTYGDSLTYYDEHNFANGALQGAYCYGYQFYLRKIGMLTTNRGASGETTVNYCSRIKQASDLSSYDYLIMMGGDNDDRLSATIGTIQPVGSTFDATTVIGALQSAIEYALTANPKLRIIVMTPPIGWTYQDGAFDRVSVLIPQAYENVAKQYGLPLIDLYNESGINELTRATYYLDPTTNNTDYMYHPNNEGWKRISRIIIGKLASI